MTSVDGTVTSLRTNQSWNEFLIDVRTERNHKWHGTAECRNQIVSRRKRREQRNSHNVTFGIPPDSDRSRLLRWTLFRIIAPGTEMKR